MKYIVISLLMLAAYGLRAQDFAFGKVKEVDFDVKSELLDSSSNGIVINEYGYANIGLSAIVEKGFEIEYYYHVLLKVLNKEGYDQADFSLPLYHDNSNKESIVEIKGFTYNLDGGQLVKVELGKQNIITEKTSEKYNLVKIAFPQVKEGSIIELRYKTKSPFLFSLNAWTFQTDIPKIRSEFVTRIPEICNYKINLKGSFPLSDRKVESFNTHLHTEIGEVQGQKTSYIMENIPAFVSEDYMTAEKNFTSILTFELAGYSIPFGTSKNFSVSWEDVHRSLLEDENFGGQLRRKAALKEFIDPILIGVTDDVQKAHTIYDYIKRQIKWNKRHGLLADVGIKKAVETHTGNSADINLALVSALSYAGLIAEPIILSTRENGYPGIYTAGLNEFNHVVARVKIDSNYFFLDASVPYEPFGNLPHKCINYQGRNIPLSGSSNWVPLQANLISSLTVQFSGKLDEEGTLSGKLSLNRGGYSATQKRSAMDDYPSIDEYFESYEKTLAHMSISNPTVEQRENCELLLKEEMEIEITNFADVNAEEIHFNPIVYGRTDKNPFNLQSRSFPVDIGAKTQENFTFVIEVPDGFTITKESLASKRSMALPNRDARFVYAIAQEGNVVTVQLLTQINKPLFLPEEYFDLKEFFSRIIQTQKNNIVLASSAR